MNRKIIFIGKILIISLLLLVIEYIIKKPALFAQEEIVKIIVRQVGTSSYSYKVTNLSSKAIKSFKIGYDYHQQGSENELLIEPTTLESPAGWEGYNVFLEESEYLHIHWHRLSDAHFIQPGSSLSGFVVNLPQSYALMEHASFTMIFRGGTIASGKIEEATITDADGDEYYTSYMYPMPSDDCNDNDNTIYPNAPELCDGKDNDCNGVIDEGCCEVEVKVSPSEVAPQKTFGNTQADVVATLKKPAPSDGCTINLSVEPVDNSGGHLHDGNRHTGGLSTYSVTITNIELVKHVKYTSGEVAGVEKIKAELVGGDEEKFEITVKMDGLTALGRAYYQLKPTPSGYKHVNFYNVQPWVKGLFDSIAQLYHKRFPTAELLVVTDASLSWGGLYDYRNTWAPPHNTHRIGTDIDVRSSNIPHNNKRRFEQIVCQATGFPYLEYEGQGNEHYHLFFYPYKGSEFKYCEPYRGIK